MYQSDTVPDAGGFLPPCGGTDAIVPSMIFRSACCTPSSGYIPCDGWIFGFSRNLVDLIDIDDTVFRPLIIAVSSLDNLQQNILHHLPRQYPASVSVVHLQSQTEQFKHFRKRLSQKRLPRFRSVQALKYCFSAAPRPDPSLP